MLLALLTKLALLTLEGIVFHLTRLSLVIYMIKLLVTPLITSVILSQAIINSYYSLAPYYNRYKPRSPQYPPPAPYYLSQVSSYYRPQVRYASYKPNCESDALHRCHSDTRHRYVPPCDTHACFADCHGHDNHSYCY